MIVPNCGKTQNVATARLVNAKLSEAWYPWMTFILRYEPNYQLIDGDIEIDREPKEDEEFTIRQRTCTGSMISSR